MSAVDGSGAAQHVAGDDVHLLRVTAVGDAASGDLVHGRLLQDGRGQVRPVRDERTRIDARAACDIQQMPVLRKIDGLRNRLRQVDAAAIHRRRELGREFLRLHRLVPVFLLASPVGRLARSAAP